MSSVGSPLASGSALTMDQIAAALIAPTAPMGEATTPAVGNVLKAQAADHQHPRLTSTTYATVTSGSTVQVDFTYKGADGNLGFVKKPGIVCFEIEGDTSATSQPATFKAQSFIQDPATLRYTGAIIKVWRAQVVPQNLATLLLGAVFSLFGASVVGTQFSCVAIARSD